MLPSKKELSNRKTMTKDFQTRLLMKKTRRRLLKLGSNKRKRKKLKRKRIGLKRELSKF